MRTDTQQPENERCNLHKFAWRRLWHVNDLARRSRPKHQNLSFLRPCPFPRVQLKIRRVDHICAPIANRPFTGSTANALASVKISKSLITAGFQSASSRSSAEKSAKSLDDLNMAYHQQAAGKMEGKFHKFSCAGFI